MKQLRKLSKRDRKFLRYRACHTGRGMRAKKRGEPQMEKH